jgi:uncharacterized protein
MNIFHLAIPTHDIAKSKIFYNDGLGAVLGREYSGYVIFNFFGHQLVCHLSKNKIDKNVSMYPRHFGIIFENKEDFDEVYNRAKVRKLAFYEDLFERFSNKPGNHWSFFLVDCSNNLLEFKYYVDKKEIC